MTHNSKVIVIASVTEEGKGDTLINLFDREKAVPPENLENPVITPYKLKAKEVLKGEVKKGDTLKVYQDGGIYENKEYRIAGQMTRLECGREYLLFLIPTTYLPDYLIPLTVSEGVYEIKDNQLVFPDKNKGKIEGFAKESLFGNDINLDNVKGKIKKFGI